MLIGPKYKIARRLGAPVFEKTQTAKFNLSKERKQKGGTGRKKARTDYGVAMNEKQKARFSYGLTERQFRKYVKEAINTKGNSAELLIRTLESRLDNVVLRLGLATTRRGARQMVSHGHITVNGVRVTIPSYKVSVGDKITIREGSKKSTLFATLDERAKTLKIPAWLKYNIEKKEGTVDGAPKSDPTELLFDVGTVLEFYSK
jgi:small subunit ribosomal protein S4